MISRALRNPLLRAVLLVALVSVPGTPARAAVTATPDNVNFGSAIVGTTTPPIRVILNNKTRSKVQIASVSTSLIQFSYLGPSLPVTVAPGGSLTVLVTFKPSAAHSYSGQLVFTRLNGSAIKALLSGTGVPSQTATGTSGVPGSSSGTSGTSSTPSNSSGGSPSGTESSQGQPSATPMAVTSTLPGGIAQAAYGGSFSVSGGTPPYAWSIIAGSLPPDLSLNASTGSVTGTPVDLGTFNFTVQAKDSSSPSQTASASASIAISAPQPAGNNYYVSPTGSDTNVGSAAYPWATIQQATTRVAPGDTVHVLPGNYSGPITNNTSGNATNRILFVSDTTWGAKITFSSTEAISGFANFGNYVDIEGFDVSGNGGDGTVGIDQEGSFSRVISCRVHDISLPAASNGGAGIDNSNYSAVDDDIIGNVVFNIVGTSGPNSVQGIYHSIKGGHIWNNIVYGISGWGIHLWHNAGGSANDVMDIANNLVFNCTNEGGIVVGSGDYTGGSDDYVTVTNNIVIGNNASIAEETDGIDTIGTHVRYLNNILYQNTQQYLNTYGHSFISGTILANPLLINYQSNGSGNYHLASGSPCIGAGVIEGAPTYDFAGLTRMAPIDIGPYAYTP